MWFSLSDLPSPWFSFSCPPLKIVSTALGSVMPYQTALISTDSRKYSKVGTGKQNTLIIVFGKWARTRHHLWTNGPLPACPSWMHTAFSRHVGFNTASGKPFIPSSTSTATRIAPPTNHATFIDPLRPRKKMRSFGRTLKQALALCIGSHSRCYECRMR